MKGFIHTHTVVRELFDSKYMLGRGWQLVAFWCEICDLVLIDPAKPETGTFYQAVGHVLNYKTKTLEQYETVIYAVCSHCAAAYTEQCGRCQTPLTSKIERDNKRCGVCLALSSDCCD